MAIKLNLNLNKREQNAVAIGAAVLAIFVVFKLIIFPLFDKNDELDRKLATRGKELADIRLMQAEYRQTANKAERAKRFLQKRPRGFTLFSFLETLAGRTNVKSNIAYMRPTRTARKDSPYRSSMVEMKLQGITLEQLLAYLHGIETSANMISIKRLSVTRAEQKADLIHAVFQVETLER